MALRGHRQVPASIKTFKPALCGPPVGALALPELIKIPLGTLTVQPACHSGSGLCSPRSLYRTVLWFSWYCRVMESAPYPYVWTCLSSLPYAFGRFCRIDILVRQFCCTLSFLPASESPAIDVSLVSPQCERALLRPRPLWHDTCSLLSYLAYICMPARLTQRG